MDATPSRGLLGIGLCHPRLPRGRLEELQGLAPLEAGVRHLSHSPAESVVRSPRLRYVPAPTLLLFHALDSLFRDSAGWLAEAVPERLGLFLDPGAAYLALQEEFYRPLAVQGEAGASPLLFPHIHAASAASLAAVNFNLKGPCLVAQSDRDGFGPLRAANLSLRAGAIDYAFVAAIHYSPGEGPAAARSHGLATVPPANCAAAALLGSPQDPGSDAAPELEACLGELGHCRWLFAAAWARYATPAAVD